MSQFVQKLGFLDCGGGGEDLIENLLLKLWRIAQNWGITMTQSYVKLASIWKAAITNGVGVQTCE